MRDVTVLACVGIAGVVILASVCIINGIDHTIAAGAGMAVVEILNLAYHRLKK